jgi:hypothetical protein
MIAVECFPDEILVRSMGIPVARITHQKGKGNVVNAVIKGQASIGLIDEDPDSAQPSDLTRFRSVQRQGAVALMEHSGASDRRLAMISPRLEEWLIARAVASDVRPTDYGLPETAKDLKRRRYDRLPKYRTFLDQLGAKDAEFKALRTWLTGT